MVVIEWSMLALGLVSLMSTDHRVGGDGKTRMLALDAMLRGHWAPQRFSLIGPMFASPMWLAGQFFGGPRAWLAYYNLVVFAVGLLLVFLLLRGRVDDTLLRRFLLLLVTATMIPANITDFYGETFSAMTVGVGVIAVFAAASHPRLPRWGWIAIILGTANSAATTVGLAFLTGERALVHRRVRYAVPVMAVVALVLGENWVRRGDPLDQGYAGESFSYPMVMGVLAILLSFGKGLVFFTPGLTLPIRRKLQGLYDANRIDLFEVYRGWMLYLGGLVLVYANWWAWSGDLYWGPRFFLLAIFPASLALAAWLTRPERRPLPSLALLGVLAMSIWVAADSTVFETLGSPRCYVPGNLQEDYCRFGVVDSDLWYPFTAWPLPITPVQLAQLAFFVCVGSWLAAAVLVPLLRATAERMRRSAAWRWREWTW
jgi:hypothetical protein